MGIQAVPTLGELASSVFSSPCTIHGWRPISVRTQPAHAAMYGNAYARIALHWNQRAVSSFPSGDSHPAPLELPLPVQPRAHRSDHEHQHAREGHYPHRPVDDPHVRHVVARAVLALLLGLELVEALDLAVERARRHVPEESR